MQKQWGVKTEIACDSKIALLDHKVLDTTRSKRVKCVWKVCEMHVKSRSHVKHICEIKLCQNLSSFTCIWNTIQCVKLKGKTFNLQLGMWNNMRKKNVDFYMWNYHVKKKNIFIVWKLVQFELYEKSVWN